MFLWKLSEPSWSLCFNPSIFKLNHKQFGSLKLQVGKVSFIFYLSRKTRAFFGAMMKKHNTFVWGILRLCQVVKPDHGMLRYALVRLDKNTVLCLDILYHWLQLACWTRRFWRFFDPGEWCDFDLNSRTWSDVGILSEMTENNNRKSEWFSRLSSDFKDFPNVRSV